MTKMKTAICKKILLTVLAVFSFLTLFKVSALATTEAEVNSSKKLALNYWENDELENEDKYEWYKAEFPKNGRFRVWMRPGDDADETTINAGWRFDIYEKSALTDPIKESKNVQSEYVTEWMAFAPTTVYIKVYAVSMKPTSHIPTCPFKLMVEYEESDYFEKEINDKASVANAIETNALYAGSLYKKDDTDWFSYNVTMKGRLSSRWLKVVRGTKPVTVSMSRWK